MADEPAAQSFSTSSDGQYELRFTISENVPIGTFIGIIKSDSKSTIPIEPPFLIVPIPGDDWQSSSPSSLSSRTNSNMRVQSPPYSIGYDGEIGKNMAGNDNQAGTVDTDLNIDQSNGEIRTAIELDRERRSQYSFIAISLTGVNIHVKIVSIRHRDSFSFPLSIFLSVIYLLSLPSPNTTEYDQLHVYERLLPLSIHFGYVHESCSIRAIRDCTLASSCKLGYTFDSYICMYLYIFCSELTNKPIFMYNKYIWT